ncbi:unnamed protein product [Timema podura]|uniref:Uncharacterized protein n=1 Tax=Timema podura TaxID=61482 RepID=A0ABN7PIF6_TIMPD|nr:unnamed protein product [Timema podura]
MAKRQMPDMDMIKDIAPALIEQMVQGTTKEMQDTLDEGGTEDEAMERGTKKILEMGASAMQMFQSMQGLNLY